MSLPQVSVLISCYNAVEFLSESIESVLQQTFTDFELILIDDGSKDNTLNIINRYAMKDTRIKVVKKENTGLTDSLNVGIHLAKGKWIARLDADDIAFPNRLEEQVLYMTNNKDIMLLGSNFDEINEKGGLIKHQMYPASHNKLLSNLETARRFFPHSSVMFNIEIVRNLGGYNDRIHCAEDLDLWLRIGEQGKIACLNMFLVKIRKHARQISHHDRGKTQILYDLAARVCHFIRFYDGDDPSTSEDEITWQEFIKWVDQRMMKHGVFERRKAWASARAVYFDTENRFVGIFYFASILIQSGYVSALIWEKLFGSSLPKRLAREWIEQKSILGSKKESL